MYYYNLKALTNLTSHDITGNASNLTSSSLTFTGILFPFLVLLFTYLIAGFIERTFFKFESIQKKRKYDHTSIHVTRSVILALVYLSGFTAFIYLIPTLREIAFGLFAGVGIVGVVLAYAAKDFLANILAGMLIVTFRPFSISDRINVGDNEGYVEDINLRHIVIRNWQNNRIILPNHLVARSFLSNFSLSESSVVEYIDIGISRESDIELARKIMIEEAEKDERISIKTVESTGELVSPAVNCHGYRDNSTHIRLTFWAPSKGESYSVKYRLYENIKARFDKEGVGIPFTHRTMVYKKDIPKPSP